MNSTCTPKSQTHRISSKSDQNTKHENFSNTININSYSDPEICENQTSSQILVSPQPLKLNFDTPTDWPTVITGVGSVLTTFLVGWLSYVTQRSQIRSNIATFRQEWLSELRLTSAEFLACAAQLHLDIDSDNEFLAKPESNSQYSKLIMLQSKIELMLDKKHTNSRAIENLLSKIIDFVKDNDEANLDIAVNEFHSLMRDTLENTWQQIKRDLSGRKAS